MKKIRIKVKHLLLTAAIMIIAVCFILPNALFIYAQATEQDNMETSKVYYKKYIDLFPFGNRRAEALYNLAQEIVPGDGQHERYKIYSTGFSGGGQYITSKMIENAVSYYNEILEGYEDSSFYPKAYEGLLGAYTMAGSFDKVQSLVDEGLNSGREDISLTASKYSMLIQMIGKDYKKGLEIGSRLIDEGKADPDIYMLIGDISFYDGNMDDALKYYEKAKDAAEWKGAKETQKFTLGFYKDAWPVDMINRASKIKNGYKGDSSIHGKVVINGKPAPFVYVYLKDERDGELSSIGLENRYITAITGFDGSYEIPGLPEGNYILGIGIPTIYLDNSRYQAPSDGYFHLEKGEAKAFDFTFTPPMEVIEPKGSVLPRDGKVEVEWEEVEGAAYYLLRLVSFESPGETGTYAAFSPGGKITDTKHTIDINRVNAETHGFMMDDEGRLNPQAYIGVLYPGSMVPFYIEAIDREGTLLKSSVPMKLDFKDMSIIRVPEEGLTDSDRLVLDGKVEEAVESYEKDLLKNPDDIHAMTVLSKIYSIGTRRKYVPEGEDIIEGVNRDRAMELSNRLCEITGDIFYLKSQLNRMYSDENDYEWIIEQYEKIPEEEYELDDYGRLATLNLRLGNYEEADRYFDKVYETVKDTNYYDLAPVILRMYLDDFEGSLRFLKILDLRLYSVDKDNLISDIEKLSAMDRTGEEYEKFCEALEILFKTRRVSEYRDKYKAAYNKVEDPVMKDILKASGNYYHVFDNR